MPPQLTAAGGLEISRSRSVAFPLAWPGAGLFPEVNPARHRDQDLAQERPSSTLTVRASKTLNTSIGPLALAPVLTSSEFCRGPIFPPA